MKKKKKSKLQKKIDDPHSRLWRNKADKAWKQLVAWAGSCIVCGSVEFCQAHHLIPREMTSHRHIVENGAYLCASHHKYSFEMSPHKAPVSFFNWFSTKYPERWTWLLQQTPSRTNVDTFKEIYEKLNGLLQT